jgi:hypothetical protein
MLPPIQPDEPSRFGVDHRRSRAPRLLGSSFLEHWQSWAGNNLKWSEIDEIHDAPGQITVGGRRRRRDRGPRHLGELSLTLRADRRSESP